MSRKASPWENGYQESFYSQFKVDLGDPNSFESLGELVAEIYRLIFVYNYFRIHSKLKMRPQFLRLGNKSYSKVEPRLKWTFVSDKRVRVSQGKVWRILPFLP